MRKGHAALLRLQRLIRNASLDFRYGGFLGGIKETPYAHLGVENTANTDYEALREIFKDGVRPSDVLVDVGCGKGRVINWWLSQGFENKMIGIELDKDIANDTRHRLRRHKNVEIVGGDAIKQLPKNGTVFYLYNPFKQPWVAALRAKLSASFGKTGGITIYYYNCLHVDVFRNDNEWFVQEIELSPPFHRLAVIKCAIDGTCHESL